MDGQVNEGQTLIQWMVMDPWCVGVLWWWGLETNESSRFFRRTHGQAGRQVHTGRRAGIVTKQQEGHGWKGRGWMRGEAKYLPRASDGQNGIKTEID